MFKVIALSVVALAIGSGAALWMNRVEAARAGSAGVEVRMSPSTRPAQEATPLSAQDNTGKKGKDKRWNQPPEMKIDPNKSYTATFETSKGNVVVDLFAKEAPKTVNNFVFLAREDFYDGIIFHRVIPEFMIQGGDPTGTGTGGPGYQFEDETGPANPHRHVPGTLSMANAGPGTNGSQFFLTEVETPHLDGRHTVFGRVRTGLDVIKQIARVRTGPGDKPAEDVVIKDVKIEEK